METWHLVVLAVLQGLTEFLPISSSAHLIFFPKLLGWPDQGLAFDVAVHLGTLIAVLGYFRKDVAAMLAAWFASVARRRQSRESRLAWGVIFGTVPVGLCGLFFGDYVETTLRSTVVIAIATIICGLLLWWADSLSEHERDEYTLSWADVFVVGIAQAIALIPGTSRSGITITAGVMLGLSRTAAARFSFLLSIPVIVLAGLLELFKVVSATTVTETWFQLTTGVVCSALTAYLSIHFFLKLLDRIGFVPFVVYRLILGLLLFAL